MRSRLRRLLIGLLIGLAGLGLVLLILWWIVVIPALLLGVDQLKTARQIQDPAKRLDEVNGLRTTLAGVLGGLAVIAGAVVGALNFRETSRQNRAVLEKSRAELELQRRGQITERFTRAIEQLGQRGSEKLDIRIGAVYALEQIARDSGELHWPIMEVLTAYVREHSRVPPKTSPPGEPSSDSANGRLAADLQAIATVLGRRDASQDAPAQELDLHEVDLGHVEWARANLEIVDLRWSQLEGADIQLAKMGTARLGGADLRKAWLFRTELPAARLGGVQLSGAHLWGANLEGAYLFEANLEGASFFDPDMERESQANLVNTDLRRANLQGADLTAVRLEGTDLEEAQVKGAVLEGANLSRAKLMKAHLAEVNLKRADLSGADLEGAVLAGANLTGANLSGANLDDAFLIGALGLTWEQLESAASLERVRLPTDLAARLAEVTEAPSSQPRPEAPSQKPV